MSPRAWGFFLNWFELVWGAKFRPTLKKVKRGKSHHGSKHAQKKVKTGLNLDQF